MKSFIFAAKIDKCGQFFVNKSLINVEITGNEDTFRFI